jgi:hypothetical protein
MNRVFSDMEMDGVGSATPLFFFYPRPCRSKQSEPRRRPQLKAVTCPAPAELINPNIVAPLNNAIAPAPLLQHHEFLALYHIKILFKLHHIKYRNHGSPILRRRKLQDVCHHPSSEYRNGTHQDLTRLKEWDYQVHQGDPGELEQRKARPQHW